MELPAPGNDTRTLLPGGLRVSGSDRFYLVVVREGSSSLFHFPFQGVVTVGRAPECDLPIDDGSMSRRHARFVISESGLQVQDLDSRNGTRVNGEVIDGARSLLPGDVVTLGLVTLVLSQERGARRTQGFLEASELRQRVQAEAERALKFQRPLAVVTVGFTHPPEFPRAEEALLASLRRTDLAGWFDAQHAVLVFPEQGAAQATRIASEVQEALDAYRLQTRIGIASSPMDGCDFDTLISASRAAMEQARPGTICEAMVSSELLRVGDFSVLVADAAMHRLYALIRRLAASDLPVLVTGETGTGKELAAHAVHAWSPRSSLPFVVVNCAALQDTLVESELFGHERGAFSGAVASKVGLLESARGGTVFLDEVGELSAPAQAKLLRALESGKINRVGDVKERSIDIRLVAATHRDLEADAAAGRFRSDLLFRLRAATVVLPPLRDRPREIPLLARTFLDAARAATGRGPTRFSLGALQTLVTRAWPGNVRELKNVMRYVAATVEGEAVQAWHVAPGPAAPSPSEIPAAAELPAVAAPVPQEPVFTPLHLELRTLERQRMVEALEAAGGQQNKAAKLLGMPLRTFTLKVKKYGLNRGAGP